MKCHLFTSGACVKCRLLYDLICYFVESLVYFFKFWSQFHKAFVLKCLFTFK